MTRHVMKEVLTRGNTVIAICECGHSERGYDRTKTIAALYSHTIHATKPECPTPKKNRYGNEGEARNAIANFLRRARPGARPTHAYKCPSGQHWHTTSQPASKVA